MSADIISEKGGDTRVKVKQRGDQFLAPADNARFGGLPERTIEIRERTDEEKNATQFVPKAEPTERFERILASTAINEIRYIEATGVDSDAQRHLEELLEAGSNSLIAWARYFSELEVNVPAAYLPTQQTLRPIHRADSEVASL